MGFTTIGTQVTEHSRETGPQGRALRGDGERGLKSHGEAVASTKDRAKHPAGSAVGFADTPAVKAAFETLTRVRETREDLAAKVEEQAVAAGDQAAAKARAAAAPGAAAASAAVSKAEAALMVEQARQALSEAEAAAKPAGPSAAPPPVTSGRATTATKRTTPKPEPEDS